MSIVKVSKKGQIVIPKALRKKYRIQSDDYVWVGELHGKILVMPLLRDPVKQARGLLKGESSLTQALLEERRREREREEIRSR